MCPTNPGALSRSPALSDSPAVDGPVQFQLSAAQLEIWLAHQLDLTNPSYNCGGYLELSGAIDEAVLARAVQQAVDECEPLRAQFLFTEEGPRQRISAVPAPLVARA